MRKRTKLTTELGEMAVALRLEKQMSYEKIASALNMAKNTAKKAVALGLGLDNIKVDAARARETAVARSNFVYRFAVEKMEAATTPAEVKDWYDRAQQAIILGYKTSGAEALNNKAETGDGANFSFEYLAVRKTSKGDDALYDGSGIALPAEVQAMYERHLDPKKEILTTESSQEKKQDTPSTTTRSNLLKKIKRASNEPKKS